MLSGHFSGAFAGPCGKIRVRKQYVLFFRIEVNLKTDLMFSLMISE